MRSIVAALALLLAGCVTVDVGGAGVAHTQYVLTDAGPTPAHRATPVGNALLIQSDSGDPLADSLSIAYARRPGERALYQLATWTERPSRRIPQLLERRLDARGSFRAVALIGQPLRADWLLGIAIEDIYHDASTEPAVARLTVRAVLFDRHKRMQVARQTFSAAAAVAEGNSSAAAAAMNQAVAKVLDALMPWIEQEVERNRGSGG